MTGIVKSFIETFESDEKHPIFPPWSDAPRQENYFKLYEALAPQIELVAPEMTEEAVRFYTFLRILRDAASPFATL
jgi:hypothetical protein